LSLRKIKKWLFLKGWGPFLKRMNVLWHASSDDEATEIRAALPWARVKVNQDQISLPYEPIPPMAIDGGRARLVFISRISAKKNLDMVLMALRGLSRAVQFDIYGPLQDADYWSRCKSLIREAPSFVEVKYRGELAAAEVRPTFSRYDAFIFPTRGENFGHVIAESLSASCPVVCSDRTPWSSVLETGGGSVVRDFTAGGVGKELERIAAMTPNDRFRARQAAGSAYRSWRKTVLGPNILEEFRLSEALGRR